MSYVVCDAFLPNPTSHYNQTHVNLHTYSTKIRIALTFYSHSSCITQTFAIIVLRWIAYALGASAVSESVLCGGALGCSEHRSSTVDSSWFERVTSRSNKKINGGL